MLIPSTDLLWLQFYSTAFFQTVQSVLQLFKPVLGWQASLRALVSGER